MAFLLRESKILTKLLTPIEKYSLLLAAICHDVDHTGRTNAYEILKISKLSLKYNDESVLENHHASATFKILCNENYNIFADLSDDIFKSVRKLVITNILATDMK